MSERPQSIEKAFKRLEDYDIEKALQADRMLWAEFNTSESLEDDLLIMKTRPNMAFDIHSKLKSTIDTNSYGEHDNYDFRIYAGYSKQKGIGKSTMGLHFKEAYDYLMGKDKLDIDQVFFSIKEKLDYYDAHAGDSTPMTSVMDEMLDMVGASSRADLIRLQRIETINRLKGHNSFYHAPDVKAWFPSDYDIAVVCKDIDKQVVIGVLKTKNGLPLAPVCVPPLSLKSWKPYHEKKMLFSTDVELAKMVKYQYMKAFEEIDKMFNLRKKFEEMQWYKTEKAKFDAKITDEKPVKPTADLSKGKVMDYILAWRRETTVTERSSFATIILDFILPKDFAGEVIEIDI